MVDWEYALKSEDTFLSIKVQQPGSWQSDLLNLSDKIGVTVDQLITLNPWLLEGNFPQNNRDYIPILVKEYDGGNNPDPGPAGIFAFANNICPLPTGTYTFNQAFGGTGGHNGVDLGAAAGTAIIAVQDGTVITVHTWDGHTTNESSLESYGNYCVLQHVGEDSQAFFTWYAHQLTTPSVSVGQAVLRGQQIGQVGSTGNSTGNHLHIEVRQFGNASGNRVNPEIWIPNLRG